MKISKISIISIEELSALRVTIMGLGLHGGGLSSALFFASIGSDVTVTDLRDENTLKPSLDRLAEFNMRTVLGRHEERDFRETDLVIKNPAVPPDSPYLAIARMKGIPVETDISIFLSLFRGPLIGVTGSKGKSTTASAIHHCLKRKHPGARLGGNITVSPLDFLDRLEKDDPVVLELSSWQLGDLKGEEALSPKIAVLTILLPDHQDKYPDLTAYIADKKVLFDSLDAGSYAVLNFDDPLQKDFAKGFAEKTCDRVRYFSEKPLPERLIGAYLKGDTGWIRDEAREHKILGRDIRLQGRHNRLNLLCAGLAAFLFGLSPEDVLESLSSFPGIEHRLEFVCEKNGITFYNDSAATIPEATRAAIESFSSPVVLIMGGTDKNLDFSPLLESLSIPRAIFLLNGSASVKIQELLERAGITYSGPFMSLEEAVKQAFLKSDPGSSILFSPGCTSFEMFLNEFDRGNKFKSLAKAL